ncbi:MAG: hypothetical protein IH586_00685 [Anaerolineaceae bacterium]|nr:hypothetical protein [Anaerolineaceae bacterium]
MDPEIPYLTPAEFAILPWGWTPADADVLGEIRRCGFNLAGFIPPEALDLAGGAGLQAILFDESAHVSDSAAELDAQDVRQRVGGLVSRAKGHPALFGYYLRDEPGVGSFAGLARWAQAYHAADPQGLAYLNLFPNYATPAQLGVESYTEYVERFVQVVAPPFLSYDHYALMQDGSLRGSYFENLEVVRAAAMQAGIPFWNIVLANAHFDYAEPSAAGLRFQVYTTLAYGARGISYFTYFAPDSGNYRLAAVDQFGDKTPTWDLLRQVNLQIHRLGPTYLALKSVHVFHTPELPDGTLGPETSRLVAEISAGSFVVGEFEAPDGRPHILVVNKDLQRAVALAVRFQPPGKLLRTSPYSGKTAPVGGEDLWLAPGQGVLLGLD